MRLYARPSWMLIRQLIADAFVVAWGLFWWWAGRLTDTTIRAIAEPSRHVAGALRQMRDNIGGAAGRVGEIPYVGGDVRVPFDRLTGDVDGMIASADGQVHAIENAATLMGWVTFALPLLLLIIIWLPWRLRFVRRSSATLALVRQTNGSDLLALRALATQPISERRRSDPDPVGAWRVGDSAAITALADLELARAGVRRPRRRRASLR